MSDVNADKIRSVLNDPDPVIEAFSMLLRSVAGEAVEAVAVTLEMVGQDPTQLPGEFFVQAVLVEADKIFVEISRERWIAIFDHYHEVKEIVNNDPALKAEVAARGTKYREATAPQEAKELGLLDGNF